MLADDIKKKMMQALKDRDDVTKEVLGVALGDIQTAEARGNRPLRDEETLAIVRKLVKSNEETLAALGEKPEAKKLRRENEVLGQLLPATMGVADIVVALAAAREAIVAAKSDGQATGIAVKSLKALGANCDGTDVAAAVKQIRTLTP